MPIYSYQCKGCEKVLDFYRAVEDRKKPVVCSYCGEEATRIPEMFFADVFEPYYDESLGSDVYSRRDKRRIMEKLGVEEAGDRVGGARNFDSAAPIKIDKMPLQGIRLREKPERSSARLEVLDEQGKVVDGGLIDDLPSVEPASDKRDEEIFGV